jgi:hypothetical protein
MRRFPTKPLCGSLGVFFIRCRVALGVLLTSSFRLSGDGGSAYKIMAGPFAKFKIYHAAFSHILMEGKGNAWRQDARQIGAERNTSPYRRNTMAQINGCNADSAAAYLAASPQPLRGLRPPGPSQQAQWPDYVVINRRRNFTFDRARRELLGTLADVLGDVARGGHTVKPGRVDKCEALQMPASFSISICAMRRLRKPLINNWEMSFGATPPPCIGKSSKPGR